MYSDSEEFSNDSLELIAFDDQFDENENETPVTFVTDFDSDEPEIGNLYDNDISNKNVLESIVAYMDIKDIRALGRTSDQLWKRLNDIWNNNLMWKTKIERHIGMEIPSDVVYDNWSYIYDIILDNNYRQLFLLRSPSMVKLAILLGEDPSLYSNSVLRTAIRRSDFETVKVLLQDKRVDPDNKILKSYLNDPYFGPEHGKTIQRMIDNRYR